VKKILVLDRSEELAEQVRAVTADFATAPEVVSCTKIGSNDHVQEHDGPFAVLVAGPSLGTRAGLRRLASLHREVPETQFVVAFAREPDASLREIVQVGAVDLVDYPADDMSLRAALKRALEMAVVPRGAAEPASAALAPASTAQRSARIFTVCSATGGCGKTFYATNMALYLTRNSDARVALVDLDLQFGEITTALRLQPSYTIADALHHENDDEDVDLERHIEDFMIRYDDTFWALPAPKDPAEADRITPSEVLSLLEVLRKRFDYIVVDTPTALAETVLAAFDLSEHLFVMTTLDLPSVRNLGMFLQTLQKLRIPTDNVSLVMNKVEKDVGIDVDQITKLFPQGFLSTLPYSKDVSRSVNLGQPIVRSSPEADISRRIASGLREFLPEQARARAEQPSTPAVKVGSFGRFLRRTMTQAKAVAR
jgi:pilus assembly protein CpaE